MLETARHQWAEGARRLDSTRSEAARYGELSSLVDAVTDELRRRIGQTFTLSQLADEYDGAEDWVRDVVVREAPPRARAGIRDVALVQDAAFGRYALGASDYEP